MQWNKLRCRFIKLKSKALGKGGNDERRHKIFKQVSSVVVCKGVAGDVHYHLS